MENSDKTVMMNTVKVNIIQGTIHGITQEAFETLKPSLTEYFHTVHWDQGKMRISNRGKEQYFGTYDEIERAFAKIADAMVGSKYGKLGFIGLIGKREIVGLVFFGQGNWELKEYSRPEAPAWYKNEDWLKMEKFKEDMEWDELFKRE